MPSDKEVFCTDRKPVSRRGFVEWFILCMGLSLLRRDSALLIPVTEEKREQTRRIINEIWQKHQVEILTVDDKNLNPSAPNNLPPDAEALSEKIHPFDQPEPALAQVIQETLDNIPAVGELIDVIFICIVEDSGVNLYPEIPFFATNGQYIWDHWFCSEIGHQVANERKAVVIWISDRIPLDEINSQNVYEYGHSSRRQRVALKEKFSTTLSHEIGHAFEFAVRDIHYDNFVQEYPYPEQGDYELGEWKRNFQNSHPLYSTFSQVVTLDKRLAFKRGIENQEDLARDYWQELFIDYFAASIVQPEILTPQERKYFENIHVGLRKSGVGFTKQIVEEPEILLNGFQESNLPSGLIITDLSVGLGVQHRH